MAVDYDHAPIQGYRASHAAPEPDGYASAEPGYGPTVMMPPPDTEVEAETRRGDAPLWESAEFDFDTGELRRVGLLTGPSKRRRTVVVVPGRHRRASEHRDVSGGWLRPAVFGAMDGLVTNSSLIAGAGGGGAGAKGILLIGFAGLVAGAFSMATGEYISVSSQNELTQSEVANEERELARNPEYEARELTQVFVDRGVEPALAQEVVRQISLDPKTALEVHAREELGVDPDDLPSPWTAAVASFGSFTVGALIPLFPFLIGVKSIALALVLAGIAAMAGGAAVAKLTDRSPLIGGVRQFIAAALGTGMTALVGDLIGTSIS